MVSEKVLEKMPVVNPDNPNNPNNPEYTYRL